MIPKRNIIYDLLLCEPRTRGDDPEKQVEKLTGLK